MAAVIDNVTVRQGASSIELGAKDIMTYLAILLKKDEARVRSKGFTGPIDNPSLLTALLESGLVVSFLPGIVKDSDVPVVDFVFEGVKVSRFLLVCLLLVVLKFLKKTTQIPIGSSRLRCTDVLFDPSLVGKEGTPSLFEALQVTIQASADAERRMYLWENLILAGGLSALPGLKPRLEKESTLYLSASETSNENQAKEVGWVKIPDYFLSFKDRAQDMAFVGASVVAKVMFLSTANYITKVRVFCIDLHGRELLTGHNMQTDYNEHGPSITHSK